MENQQKKKRKEKMWQRGLTHYLMLLFLWTHGRNIFPFPLALRYAAQVAIVKEMTGRNHAAQLAIVKQMSAAMQTQHSPKKNHRECPLISTIHITIKTFLLLHFYIFASMLINKISLYFNPLKSSLNVLSVNITLITNNASVSFLYFSIIWKSLCKTRIACSFTAW